MMKILYPTIGRNRNKGAIDFRWKYTGKRSFVSAFGPCNVSSFRRAVMWYIKRCWRAR